MSEKEMETPSSCKQPEVTCWKGSPLSLHPEIPTKLYKPSGLNLCVHFKNTKKLSEPSKAVGICEAPQMSALKEPCLPLWHHTAGVSGCAQAKQRGWTGLVAENTAKVLLDRLKMEEVMLNMKA